MYGAQPHNQKVIFNKTIPNKTNEKKFYYIWTFKMNQDFKQ